MDEELRQILAHLIFDIPLKVPATLTTITPNQHEALGAFDKWLENYVDDKIWHATIGAE